MYVLVRAGVPKYNLGFEFPLLYLHTYPPSSDCFITMLQTHLRRHCAVPSVCTSSDFGVEVVGCVDGFLSFAD